MSPFLFFMQIPKTVLRNTSCFVQLMCHLTEVAPKGFPLVQINRDKCGPPFSHFTLNVKTWILAFRHSRHLSVAVPHPKAREQRHGAPQERRRGVHHVPCIHDSTTSPCVPSDSYQVFRRFHIGNVTFHAQHMPLRRTYNMLILK